MKPILTLILALIATVPAWAVPQCAPPDPAPCVWSSWEIHPAGQAGEKRLWATGELLVPSDQNTPGATYLVDTAFQLDDLVVTETNTILFAGAGYTCHGVKSARPFSDPKQPVTVVDALGTWLVNINQPRYFCTGPQFVLCYKVDWLDSPTVPPVVPGLTLSHLEETCEIVAAAVL